MGLTVTTPAAEEPVSIDDAKLHLRVTTNDDDNLILALIAAARQSLEGATGRAFVTTTYRYTLPGFPGTPTSRDSHGHHAALGYYECGMIRLPRGNVSSVASVKYLDTNNIEQTVDASTYVVAGDDIHATIQPVYGQVWPWAIPHPEAVRIAFSAGYGAAASVPKAIKQAILLLIGGMYENREAQIIDARIIEIENTAAAMLIGPYMVVEAA